MTHIMVDLETLGNEPGVIIASIGAVKFDADGEHLGPEFYRNVDVQSCADAGLTVSGSTIRWWMIEQDDETRRALFDPEPVALRDAICAFSEYCRGCEYIWSHGSTFDLPILAAAYRAVNQSRPWEWKSTRDTRTLIDLVPQSELDTIKPEGRRHEHHALDDAILQARRVQAAYRWLRGDQGS